MQRDMDLVRQILLKIEENPDGELSAQPTIKGWDAKQVNYHLELMNQAGLIDARGSHPIGGSGRMWIAIKLTWNGHEFLDSARSDTIWAKAKAKLGGDFNSVSLAVLQQVLITLAKGALGLP